ncbi:protein CIP2A homolog [Neodiprion lecontei]|uniref:Protein CIP2A homolog n=1 Tax=Neodiprion lecontei TaxID=441921 RepID=A0A6J0BDM1_NEOLC|nr:protein CIP2A homolog [Neodiprion lecontei]
MEKYRSMKAFIAAALEYSKHQSETTASALQRNLGTIGASLDLSIFDPGTSIATEFYVSLYELVSALPSRSSIIWSAVAVLQHACKNSAARQTLIHTYKFTPILTRLLEANLTAEKRIRVLQLIQELTYGVKISWQEAHLPYLISTLTQWVSQSTEEEVVALSLGVLINLCYKNLPAIYTLMRAVDTKVFVKTLLKLQSYNMNTKVQCCKLLMVLESIHRELTDTDILDFATVTFCSLISALQEKNVLLLRHTVDFFDDVRQKEHSRNVLATYPGYAEGVENILLRLENNSDPECVALMMEFLVSIIRLQIPSLMPLYSKCVRTAMMWVPVERVCSKALSLIRIVITDTRRSKGSFEILNELDLSVLMLVLDSGYEMEESGSSRSIESQARLTEFLQLVQEMVRIPVVREKVMQTFTDQAMRQILRPVLEESEAATCEAVPGNLFQDPATTLHVHALSLTADLATHDSNWLTLYSELLRKKQIQMVMALALFTGDGDVKQRVLQLPSSVGFPQECISAVAKCMGELEPLVLVQGRTACGQSSKGRSPTDQGYSSEMQMPLFSIAQEERLDLFITKLEQAFESNQIQDTTTSAVMELYEYKLAAMRHAERATQASLEAANSHATSLQHRLAQVVAESSRLHQLLFYTQQCLEGSRTEKICLTAKLKEEQAQMSRTRETQSQEIRGLRKIVVEKSATIDQLNRTTAEYLGQLETSKSTIETLERRVNDLLTEGKVSEAKAQELATKINELSRVIRKMEDGSNKQKQLLEEKNREIASNQNHISALKQELQEQAEQCYNREKALSEKEECIERMKGELSDLSRMRDIIFELTAKKKEDLNTS